MVSVCLTVKGENIEKLIDNLLTQQTKAPDEIVIVEAGEKENAEVYKKYEKAAKFKIILAKCNRSEGRNLAAKNAAHENLIFIDAGCVPQPDWLAKMAAAIEKENPQIVAGAYESPQNSFKDYIFAKFLNRNITSSSFIYPSARNFAIKKYIFDELGGFNKRLNFAEDTEFFTGANAKGYHFEKANGARVYWTLPKNLKEYLSKIFSYAKGDIATGIWWDAKKKFATHNIKNLLCFLRVALILFLFMCGYVQLAALIILLILVATASRNKIDFNQFSGGSLSLVLKHVIIFASVKIVTDIAVSAGFFYENIICYFNKK